LQDAARLMCGGPDLSTYVPVNLDLLPGIGAPGPTRTSTPLRATDFESSAASGNAEQLTAMRGGLTVEKHWAKFLTNGPRNDLTCHRLLSGLVPCTNSAAG
jgi:hypothetical protein